MRFGQTADSLFDQQQNLKRSVQQHKRTKHFEKHFQDGIFHLKITLEKELLSDFTSAHLIKKNKK